MDTVYPGKPDDEFSDGTQPGRLDEESRVFATLANAFLEGDYVATTQEIPQRLDHYRILEKLGSGGMSDVWLAEHIYLKQRVAIKTLRNSMSAGNDLELAERFLREAQALAVMRGSGVRTVQDAAICEGIPYVVMELLEGKEVTDHLKRHGPLTINQTLDLLEQVGEVLMRQEQAGILHRDIKPSNIWFKEDGSFILFDYGLVGFEHSTNTARTFGVDVQTMVGEILGTPAYMAPEQIRGNDLDHRADLFSLGATALECLTGQMPREQLLKQGLAALQDAISEELPSPRELRTEVSEGLERILLSLTQLDPNNRYPNAQEFVRDLERYRYGGRRPYGSTDGTAFLAMPFSRSFDDIHQFLQEVCGEARLAARRVDRVDKTHDIWDQIDSEIRQSSVVIAVFTREQFGRWPNPNVLTEAAHARAIGKPLIILTTDPAERLPFDWRNLPILRYKNSRKGFAALAEELLPRLKHERRSR